MPKPGDVKTFVIRAMNGGMNTVSEENNLITLDPNSNLGVAFVQARTEFRNLDNFRPANRGGQSKTYGFDGFYDTGVASNITGLYRYIKSDGTSLFMYGQTTKAYKLVAGVSTDIGATFSSSAYLHFNTAQDYLVMCDGVNIAQKWDATTVTNLVPGAGADQTATTGFKATVYYQNRLFGFSATHDTSLLYYSDAGVVTAGYSSNFINCDVNDGQKITCVGLFFIPGVLEPVIVVGKERSVGIVTGDGTVANPYTFQKVSFDLGIPGFRQYTQFEQDAAFLTPRGIQSYRTAIKNVNIEQAMLTGKVYDQFTSLNQTNLPNAFSWNDWKNHRIGFAVPQENNTVPDRIWYYDYQDGSMYKQTGFSLTAAFVDTDGTVYHGDSAGSIYEHNPETHNYNGGAISATMSTGFMDFFEPDLYKQIEYCKVLVRGNGSYSFGISHQLNFGAYASSSHTINLTAGDYTWNGGVWTNDPDVYQWGASPLEPEKFFPKNIFRNIQFTFAQSGADQPVDVFELVIRVKYLNIS